MNARLKHASPVGGVTGGRLRMADYIDRNILCQAYVHINPVGLDEDDVANLKRHLELFVATRGQFFLYEEVASDVELKDGSLKLYLTIAGALYIAIGQYGSFRDGVNYLAQDTKRLADCMVSESLFLTKSRHNTTIRAEARTGVTGSLKVVVDRLDYIRGEMGHISTPATTRQIADLEDQINRLIGNLRDPADPPYVADEICKIVKEVLPKNPRSPRPAPTEDQVAAYQEQRASLIKNLTQVAKKE